MYDCSFNLFYELLNEAFQTRLNVIPVYVFFGLLGAMNETYKFMKFVSNAIKQVPRAFDDPLVMRILSRIL